jgi:hypothetical protein
MPLPLENRFSREKLEIPVWVPSSVMPRGFSGLQKFGVVRSFEGLNVFTINYKHTPRACYLTSADKIIEAGLIINKIF